MSYWNSPERRPTQILRILQRKSKSKADCPDTTTLRTIAWHAYTDLMTRTWRTGKIVSCVALTLALAGCDDWRASHNPPIKNVGEKRVMVGVLTLGASEGVQFQECPLAAPWNCFQSDVPPCNFRSDGKAASVIHRTVEKAGLAGHGFGTFGIKLIGVTAEGSEFGHMGEYLCEVVAHDVLSIEEVPSDPPEI
jgi:hypothetical protein